MSGTITADYWVWCVVCTHGRVLVDRSPTPRTLAQAAAEARRLGYKKRNGKWICPACQEKADHNH